MMPAIYADEMQVLGSELPVIDNPSNYRFWCKVYSGRPHPVS
ncbi:hypothetical protein FAM18124_02808 [Lacticaseibacillus paracasei]|nr:hypothetical protein FAM18124_02808 [Lacticaseibacillus paracasei]RND72827.1 hypothetical protein FAM18129_00498 [Lacticaseibacillus paracasei]